MGKILFQLLFSWNWIGLRLKALEVKIASWRKHTPWMVTVLDDVDLVIESAGGAALTSFVAYVQRHNPDIRIAHHSHIGASVKAAVRKGLPVIVLTRDAISSIRSQKARFPGTPLSAIILRCSLFSAVVSRLDVIVVEFKDVVASPDAAVQAINEKFGTDFDCGTGGLPRLRATEEEMQSGVFLRTYNESLANGQGKQHSVTEDGNTE